ncbi:MAG: hypothetical protein WBV69_14355 [Candidatus Sulfotelmatobacter sp.]
MIATKDLIRQNKRYAKLRWGTFLGRIALRALGNFTEQFQFSVANGDLLFLDSGWYVTHSGLTSLARRNRCAGIKVQPVQPFCDPAGARWAFEATVYKSSACKGFTGYGDANPSNVSSLVRGAEMRVAETRAVNRALRKAYGIGICSVEEIGSVAEPAHRSQESTKLPPQSANGNGNSYGAPKVRDRLCQIIRQHQLDPNLVKSYATDFCGVTSLREATREQVENFVTHLADWAEKDRNALLCQLNSYPGQKEGAA